MLPGHILILVNMTMVRTCPVYDAAPIDSHESSPVSDVAGKSVITPGGAIMLQTRACDAL